MVMVKKTKKQEGYIKRKRKNTNINALKIKMLIPKKRRKKL